MNRKFVSKSNFILRRVLNSKDNIDILVELIESILNIKIKQAKINPYLEKNRKYLPAEENFGIADLRIKTEQDEELNIGIQFIDGEHILTKMFLYYAQIHTNQTQYDDRKISKTITINIFDFIITKETKYHSRIVVAEENQEDNIELHIIELPKFNIKDKNEITLKEAWINYLKGEKIERAIRKSQKIAKLDKMLKKYWEEEKLE